MPWDDVLAAVSGAAGGGYQAWAQQDKQAQTLEVARARLETQLELQNLRAILSLALQDKKGGTAVDVANIGADSREAVATTGATSRVDVANIGATSREGIADKNRDADLEKFWGGTMPLGWGRVDATLRGQNIRSGDSRYATDVGAATSRSNADLAAETSQRNADVTDTRQRFGISARSNFLNALTSGGAVAPATAPPAPGRVTRAAPPVAPRSTPGAAATGAKTVTRAELEAIAAKRGTTAEAEAQRYQAGGYTVVP